jgi:gliding motility-associated-like protein
MNKCIFFIFFIISLSEHAYSQKILAGEMNFKADKKDLGFIYFLDTLELVLYTKNVTLSSETEKVRLYNRKTGGFLNEFTLKKTNTLYELKNDNNTCTSQNGIKVFKQTYKGIIEILAGTNQDVEGTILVFDKYFRETSISNLKIPNQTSFSIETAFKLYEKVDNLSPTIKSNSTENFMVCINQPFKINASAIDEDGYPLKYSFQTPIAGYHKANDLSAVDFTFRPSSKKVIWQNSYSLSKPLGSKGDIKIDPNTGLISGLCREKGVYVFSIKMEQITENGKLSGYTIKDIFIQVADCPNQNSTLIKPVIFENNIKATKFSICPGENKLLRIEANPNVNISWKKNNDIIPLQNSEILKVDSEGSYTVIISSNTQCSKEITSDSVIIHVKNLKPETLKNKNGYSVFWTCSGTENPKLELKSNPENFEVDWFRTDYRFQFVGTGNPLIRDEGNYGTYHAKFKNTGCNSSEKSDSIMIFPDVSAFYFAFNEIKNDTTVFICPKINETFLFTPKIEYYEVVPNHTLYRNNIPYKAYYKDAFWYEGEYHFEYGEPGCLNRTKSLIIKYTPGCYEQKTGIIAPSIFTPNGDILNDEFDLFNLTNFPDFELTIYDRWGSQVFYDKGYVKKFDGTFEGKPLPEGIYSYKIIHNDGYLEDKTGAFMLQR